MWIHFCLRWLYPRLLLFDFSLSFKKNICSGHICFSTPLIIALQRSLCLFLLVGPSWVTGSDEFYAWISWTATVSMCRQKNPLTAAATTKQAELAGLWLTGLAWHTRFSFLLRLRWEDQYMFCTFQWWQLNSVQLLWTNCDDIIRNRCFTPQ